MPNLTSVGVTAGVPTSGTGTVSTIDNLIGTAGTAAAQVLSVQGIASGTTLPVTATVSGTAAVTQSGTWTVQPGNTANTTPWLSKVGDGTNSAAIKAASTAPIATDPALVVAISPNSVNANGQATMANSAPVVVASNQSAIPIKSNASATGTQSNVASSATDVTILASNASRLGATVFNDSTQILYLLLSNATSSATVHTVQVTGGSYYEVPFGYTGVLKGLWASANGSARVTELT